MGRATTVKSRAAAAGAKAAKTAKVNGHTNDKLEDMETEPVKVVPAKRGRKRKVPEEEKPVSPVPKKRGRKRAAVEEVQQPKTKKAKVTEEVAPVSLSLPLPDIIGGRALSVGTGDVGQLGLGPDVEEKTRVAVVPGIPENIVSIAAGGLHSLCIDNQGKVHSWGCNDEGGLGRPTSCEEDNFDAGVIEGIEGKVVQITAGDCHSAALTQEGKVYGWGTFRDNNGLLGFLERGNMQRTPRLIPVEGDEAVTMIASGNNHLSLLTVSGKLLTCGCGESGQLGRLAEKSATRDCRNRNGVDALLLPSMVKVLRASKPVVFDGVWSGGENTFARDKNSGYIYAWGLNNYNQIGHPNTSTKFYPIFLKSISDKKWKQFTCGQHHSLALESTGTVYSMGRHDYGRLGLGEEKDAVIATAIPTLKDQTIACVSAAGSVSMVVSETGKAYGFGMGTSNQLSQGNDDDCLVPTELTGKQLAERTVMAVSVGGQHSLVLACPSS